MNLETKPVSFPADGHPDENQLLLALERELPTEESAEIEQHLGKCWNCRARSEEMRRGILAFVEYREKRYLPSLEPPPNHFSGFSAQLRCLAGEKSRSGLLRRIWHKLFTALAVPRQLRWASVVAGAMALILVWTEVLHPNVVSANELLARAMVAQNPPTSSQTAEPARIARQKLQIRCGRQTVVRDFQWLVGRPIQQAKWDRQLDPLRWGAPLTAEGFADWRTSLSERNEKVKRTGEFFTINTITSYAFIREASMVVRAKDFHPIEQHLRFADNRQVDLKEIAFQILDQPTGRQRAVALSQPAQTSSRKSQQARPVYPPEDLDETELQLRYTLFTHKWDLGEDLVIGRGSDRVTLSGVVSSSERGEAMRTALISLPNVQFSLRPPGPGVSGSSASRLASGAEGQNRASDPLLKSELSEAFPSAEERQGFVDRSLADSDTALSHAWALKRLVDRYSPAMERRLSPQSQIKLREMLRVHLEGVSRANADLQPLMEMLPASPVGAPAAVANWRTGISLLFTQVQEQDGMVAALVVGTRATGLEPNVAIGKFRQDHQSIDIRVRDSLRDLAADGADHGRR